MSNNTILVLHVHENPIPPERLHLESSVIIDTISCDDVCTVFVTKDGFLFGIGKLPGEYKHEKLPIKFDVDNVASAQVGYDRLLVILRDGTLMGCGAADYDALGPLEAAPILTRIPADTYDNERILFVSNLYSASAVMSESTLHVLGQTWFDYEYNGRQKCSITHITEGGKRIVDVHAGAFHMAVLNSVGELYVGGDCNLRSNTTALQKVETNHIYSTISCTNNDTLASTEKGEIIFYRNFDDTNSTEKMLYKLDEQVTKICSSTCDNIFAVTTASRKLLQVCQDGESESPPLLLHQGQDFLVGNVGHDENYYWYVLPHGEDLIARHFELMTRVRAKLHDVLIYSLL